MNLDALFWMSLVAVSAFIFGMIFGAAIRWGVIMADFRRRFYGDGPNVRVWWRTP